jgi:hypothetical protein
MTPKEQRELKEATAAISPSAQLSSATPVQQSPMPAKAATSTGSRISFVGHSPNFEIWVFNVNGKELVARNFSTQSPLQLRFEGYWDKPTFTPINTSGFKITDSTATNMIWQWAGKQYTSWWKVVYDDEEDPDSKVYLNFGLPVPYTGPARAPVGNDVKVSNKSKEDREAAEASKAQTPPVQGGGDTQTRRTQTGTGTSSTTTSTTSTAPEPAKGDLLSLAIKLGSVYMLLK